MYGCHCVSLPLAVECIYSMRRPIWSGPLRRVIQHRNVSGDWLFTGEQHQRHDAAPNFAILFHALAPPPTTKLLACYTTLEISFIYFLSNQKTEERFRTAQEWNTDNSVQTRAKQSMIYLIWPTGSQKAGIKKYEVYMQVTKSMKNRRMKRNDWGMETDTKWYSVLQTNKAAHSWSIKRFADNWTYNKYLRQTRQNSPFNWWKRQLTFGNDSCSRRRMVANFLRKAGYHFHAYSAMETQRASTAVRPHPQIPFYISHRFNISSSNVVIICEVEHCESIHSPRTDVFVIRRYSYDTPRPPAANEIDACVRPDALRWRCPSTARFRVLMTVGLFLGHMHCRTRSYTRRGIPCVVCNRNCQVLATHAAPELRSWQVRPTACYRFVRLLVCSVARSSAGRCLFINARWWTAKCARLPAWSTCVVQKGLAVAQVNS